MGAYHVEITNRPINLQEALEKVAADAHGAVNFFMGVVRNSHQGKSVTGISYDAHEPLAQKTLADICLEADGTWPDARIFASHFIGYLPVGGASILIAASSPHRHESFEVCRYIIEEVKKRLPVWKKEHYADGTSDWLPGHSLKPEAEASGIHHEKCG